MFTTDCGGLCAGTAGKCAGSVLTDTECIIQAGSLTGRLNLCSMEGVNNGSNLPDVFTGSGKLVRL